MVRSNPHEKLLNPITPKTPYAKKKCRNYHLLLLNKSNYFVPAFGEGCPLSRLCVSHFRLALQPHKHTDPYRIFQIFL